MTDVSSKGLLPQLIDVLHALSESQALLLAKVQNMRLERISSDFSGRAMTQESSDTPIATSTALLLPPPVVAETSPMLETPSDDGADEVESSSAPLIASVDLRASDEPTLTRHEPLLKGTDVGDHFSISVPAPAETSPSEESAAADLDQIALRPNPFEATHTYPTGTESDNRNYNFFDELDAQLAGLGEAGSAGDPEESIEKNDQT